MLGTSRIARILIVAGFGATASCGQRISSDATSEDSIGSEFADAIDVPNVDDTVEHRFDESSERDSENGTNDALDGGDQGLDVGADAGDVTAERVDSSDTQLSDRTLDGFDASLDAIDVPTVESGDALDSGDADVPSTVGCVGEMPAPTGVGISCDAGISVAPEYCREVHYCGGVFMMGNASAWTVQGGGAYYPMQDCDRHLAVAQSGYVDAYEVTVGRFANWVAQGMPRPLIGEVFFNGYAWTSQLDNDILPPSGSDTTSPPDPTFCTYGGSRYTLPINCITPADAIAFCWWDGKHLATEVGWEYVATNEGTSETPIGQNADLLGCGITCDYGDVGVLDRCCPSEALPATVGTHIMGDTINPAGIHDLIGGMEELTLAADFPYRGIYEDQPCNAGDPPVPVSYDGTFSLFVNRGPGWWESSQDDDDLRWAASRTVSWLIPSSTGGIERTPNVGFRCMRWETEPR